MGRARGIPSQATGQKTQPVRVRRMRLAPRECVEPIRPRFAPCDCIGPGAGRPREAAGPALRNTPVLFSTASHYQQPPAVISSLAVAQWLPHWMQKAFPDSGSIPTVAEFCLFISSASHCAPDITGSYPDLTPRRDWLAGACLASMRNLPDPARRTARHSLG